MLLTKRKYSNLLIKNLLSAKKIASGSMPNHRTPGLTENTDQGGCFQPKALTSDSFLGKKFNWPGGPATA